jgi:hypothetical protein
VVFATADHHFIERSRLPLQPRSSRKMAFNGRDALKPRAPCAGSGYLF